MSVIAIKSRFADDVIYEGEADTLTDLFAHVVNSGTYLSGAYLSGAYLSGTDLSGTKTTLAAAIVDDDGHPECLDKIAEVCLA